MNKMLKSVLSFLEDLGYTESDVKFYEGGIVIRSYFPGNKLGEDRDLSDEFLSISDMLEGHLPQDKFQIRQTQVDITIQIQE